MLWQAFGRWGGLAGASGTGNQSAITSIVSNSIVHNASGGITPTNPTHQAGDTLLCVVATRNNSGSLACATAGWVDASGYSNPIFFNSGKLYLFQNECDSSSESNPVITVASGSPNVVMGCVLRIRGRVFGAGFGAGTQAFNAAATNSIPFPNDSPSINPGSAILAIGVKNFAGGTASVISGVNAGLTWAELEEGSTLDGDDLCLAIDYAINDTGSYYTAGTGASILGFTQNDTSGSVYIEVNAS